MNELLAAISIFTLYALLIDNRELRRQRRELHARIGELEKDAEIRNELWRKKLVIESPKTETASAS